jgi:hypothetical protein
VGQNRLWLWSRYLRKSGGLSKSERSACLPEKQASLRCWNTYPSARQVRFNFSAISTNRRSASEREGLSGWRLAHASTSAVNAGGARKASIGSLPVLGRPRFLGITFLLDTLATVRYYLNLRADEKRQTSHRP